MPIVIKLDRIINDLWRLVNIPSPTGGERTAALTFGRMLAEAGARVRIDETIHRSPSVIGVLNGNRPGKTLQLAGPDESLEKISPLLQGKTQIDGKPTVYVCQNFTCSKPVTNWDELKPLLVS